MTRQGTLVGLGIGIPALALLLLSAGKSPAENRVAQDKPIKIGVVNMKDCFDDKKCAKVATLQKELNDMKDKIQAELQQMKKDYDERASKIKDVPAGGPLFKKYRAEMAELQARMKARDEVGKAELQEFWRKARGDVYDEVCKAAEAVAKAKGLDLVLKDDSSPLNEQEDDKNQVPSDMKIVYRAILYYAGSLDVTKDVLAELNKKS
jgi:Skp family chaperone for outer membrane proteins